jgi:AcrR family transcriptional regulator
MKKPYQNNFKRNKPETMRRIIQSVGIVMKTQGFESLTISKIAREAEVDRKLITRYFGGLNGLIETYIMEKDYWMIFAEQLKAAIKEFNETSPKPLITSILVDQFNSFYKNVDMQNLILWELTSSSKLMRSIHNTREMLGQELLELTDTHFQKTGIDFRAVAALLVGGIYYTILHTRHNGSMFSDVDINSEKGQLQITTAISQVVDWAFTARST